MNSRKILKSPKRNDFCFLWFLSVIRVRNSWIYSVVRLIQNHYILCKHLFYSVYSTVFSRFLSTFCRRRYYPRSSKIFCILSCAILITASRSFWPRKYAGISSIRMMLIAESSAFIPEHPSIIFSIKSISSVVKSLLTRLPVEVLPPLLKYSMATNPAFLNASLLITKW